MFGIGKLREDLRELRRDFESFKADVVRCRSITVYKEVEPIPKTIVVQPINYLMQVQQAQMTQHMSYGPPIPSISIEHGEAIRKLAEHVGVEFKYQEGSNTPTCVVIQPVKKPKNK